jgi:hypothetical protein
MADKHLITRTLVQHFFRRFFDNDTIQSDGDTLTTVVRAISVVAVPGLMIAFFLQNQYPQRPLWGAIEDQYFFVLFSFVVMGAVSIFEWEMLFPDRLDFLVLIPLSLKPLQLLGAKAAALFGFLALFLVGCNLFGAILLPAISHGDFFRQVLAHSVAVLMAGIFAALLVLALGGLLLCLLDAATFRLVSPILQMLAVMALALLLLHYAKYGDTMQPLLSAPLGNARWIPTLWFLGIYEQILRGAAAPPFAREMASYAVRATSIAAVAVLLTYPVAWTRMRKMAMEGSSRRRRQPLASLARLLHCLIRRPGERAIFHFISQTIARNNRYQVYLATYCGTGLALAVACAVTFRVKGSTLYPALSAMGLHAVMPLLLFWVIAGLRAAFAFPVNLRAGWIFPLTGVAINQCADAARKWVFFCAAGIMAAILAALRLAHWDLRHLLVQAVCGLCLSFLLTDGFFFLKQSVPFNRPRMPGRTSLPLMLTLYIGVLTPFIYGVIYMESHLEKHLGKLLLLGLITLAIHVTMVLLRSGFAEIEEELEGYEGEFQLLGLS